MESLDTLLTALNSKYAALLKTLGSNALPKEHIARTEGYISLLSSARAAADNAEAQADTRLKQAQERADKLRASADYTAVDEALRELPNCIRQEDLRRIVGGKLKNPPVASITLYSGYVEALEKSQDVMRATSLQLTEKRNTVENARRTLDLITPVVLDTVQRLERRVTEAEAFIAEARKQKPANSIQAWWAAEKAQHQLERFANEARPMMQDALRLLHAIREAFARAIQEQMAVEKQLQTDMIAVEQAAVHLELAEQDVLLRLSERASSKATQGAPDSASPGTATELA